MGILTYLFRVTKTFTSDLDFKDNHVLSISLALFEIRVPNLVFGSIFG